MSRKDKKKPKKAAFPHGFRKAFLSKSNSSLSQSLHIASYKKRINDLSKNNRLLAVALQESRVEAAYQCDLLKDFTRDSQNIMYARLKMNEMAKTMVKFVTDLEEVRTYLKTDALSRYNAFQRDNRSPNARMISKPPSENMIEEVSEISETSATEVYGDIALNLPLISKPCDDSEDVQNRALGNSTTQPADVEMAPILFVDDDAVKKKKNSSRGKSSAVSSNADKGSLTPQLDIDLTSYKRRRTSSRVMTSFILPEGRSSKSVEKKASPKRPFEDSVTPVKPESPPVLNLKQTLNEVSTHQNQVSESPLTQSKSTVISSEAVPVVNEANINIPSDVVPIVQRAEIETIPPIIQRADSNHTVLLCEDMELTDVIRPVCEMVVNSDLPTIEEIIRASEVGVNIPEKSEKCVSSNHAHCESNPLKLSDCPQNNSEVDETVNVNKEVTELPDYPQSNVIVDSDRVNCEARTPKLSDFLLNDSISTNDVQLPGIKDIEFDEEIQNVGELTFCESNEQVQQDEKPEDQQSLKVDTFSPARRSRQKKSVKYTVFFSSDESDKESPAVKKKNSQTKKLFNSRKQKSFSTFEVSPGSSKNEASSKVENEKQKNDTSVYNLDVSNSKKPDKKKYLQTYKMAKSRKDDSKELPKPLFDNCSVTKLKDGKYKFSKNEVTLKKLKAMHEQLKEQSPSVVRHCISPCGILKKNEQDSCQSKVPEKTKPAYQFSTSDEDMQKFESPIKDLTQQQVLETPISESKRVSFAPTDTVCNFRRMSVSRKIADNKKERRTSKSALDYREKVNLTTAKSHFKTVISSESTAINKADPLMFQDFSDDTELYSFAVPSDSQFPAKQCFSTNNAVSDLKIKKTVKTVKSPEKTVESPPSEIKMPSTDETEVSKDSTASDLPVRKAVIPYVRSPKQTGKLSLKRNKITQNTETSSNSTETQNQINALPLESPKTKVTKTKRKSIFKDVLIEDLKENMDLNCQISGKQQEAVQSIPCVDDILCLTVNKSNKKSSVCKKQQRKVSPKLSARRGKLQDKLNVIHPNSGKKSNPGTKSVENSPELKDILNTTITDDALLPKRRSRVVSYKEPSLTKKLRRGT